MTRLIEVSTKERGLPARITAYLCALDGRIASPDEIYDLCYGRDTSGGPDNWRVALVAHIYKARRALKPGYRILARYGLGYQLERIQQ